ncbi:MAG: hypothetical protein ISP86_06010 [Shewanellaceae bacterium]|nr:hypothetical protein [Shewanellaceae bacterium]
MVGYYHRGWRDEIHSFNWFSLKKTEDRIELIKHEYQSGAPSAVETLIAIETDMNQMPVAIFEKHVHIDTSDYSVEIESNSMDFLARDCSDNELNESVYTSSMQVINEEAEQKELYLNKYHIKPEPEAPVSLEGSQCLYGERGYTSKRLMYDFASNQNKTAHVHFVGHCQSQPALIFIDKFSPNGQKLTSERYSVPASLTSFIELDGTRGQYLNNIAGISERGDTVAVNLIEHNHEGFLLGTLEVIVIKDGTMHRLPMQKTLNTAGALSDAKLSNDGHRVVIAQGSSIKLYEYDTMSNAYIYKAQHSLESLYPNYYSEGSLRISADGLTASFRVYSREDGEKLYQVTFD